MADQMLLTKGEEEMLSSVGSNQRGITQLSKVALALTFIDTSLDRLWLAPMPVFVIQGCGQVSKSQQFFGTDANSESSHAFNAWVQRMQQAAKMAADIHCALSLKRSPLFLALENVSHDEKMPPLSFARDADEWDERVRSRRQIPFPDRENPKFEVAWHQQQRQQRLRINEKRQQQQQKQTKRCHQQQPRQSRQQYEKKNQRPDINYNVHKPKARKCVKK
jgi:hypothetical protein